MRRQWVEHCLHLARTNAKPDESVKSRANELQRGGLKPIDALHVACAETGGARHFLTCEDRLIRRYAGKIQEIWRIKDTLSASYGHSVKRPFAETSKREKMCGHPLVEPPKRRKA